MEIPSYYHQFNSPLATNIPSQPFTDHEELVSSFQRLSTTASGSGVNRVPISTRINANSVQTPATRTYGHEEQRYELFGSEPLIIAPSPVQLHSFNNGAMTYNHRDALGYPPFGNNFFQNYPALTTTPDLGHYFPGTPYINFNSGSQQFQSLRKICNSEERLLATKYLGSTDSFIIDVNDTVGAVDTPLGFRALEKIIKVVIGKPRYIAYVMRVLKPHLLSLMFGQNGNRIIKCFIEYPHLEENKHIFEVAVINFVSLATTSQGCLSLKALIEFVGPLSVELICKILDNALYLSENGYGNYVVQDALEHHPYIAVHLCERIRGSLFKLSMDQYGSPVIEKCIKSSAIDVVVSELLSDSKQLVELALDKFGNYVVQKALKETKGRAFDKYLQLVEILRKSSRELENHISGRNVYKHVKKADKYTKKN